MKKLLYILLFVPLTFLGQGFLAIEQESHIELPQGWSMFGFSCLESQNVISAFEPIIDNVIIVKDGSGNAFLPDWNFNGIGALDYSMGYQIKLSQEVYNFQFCPVIVPLLLGCMDETAFNYNPSANMDDGSCESIIVGCSDSLACNYNSEADTDNGSCEFAEQGYDCQGNIVAQYQVGDLAEGGIVFYVDETGQHGLVAAIEDIEGTYEWGCYGEYIEGADGQAIGTGLQNTLDIVAQNCQTVNGGITAAQAALDAEINDYNDWFLPSKDELLEMYSTIGQGSAEGNIVGFQNDWYWSSSEYSNLHAWGVAFYSGYSDNGYKDYTDRVRAIRAF